MTLLSRLYIKQPPLSTTSIAGDAYEPEWYEYKIKETNMFTVDKYQQVSSFNSLKTCRLPFCNSSLKTLLRGFFVY